MDGTVAENYLCNWDVAAAETLLLEAGGAVSDCNGAEFRYNTENAVIADLVAAGPKLHADLVAKAGGELIPPRGGAEGPALLRFRPES